MDKNSVLNHQIWDFHHALIDTSALNRNGKQARFSSEGPVKVMAHSSGLCENIQGTSRNLASQYVSV